MSKQAIERDFAALIAKVAVERARARRLGREESLMIVLYYLHLAANHLVDYVEPEAEAAV